MNSKEQMNADAYNFIKNIERMGSVESKNLLINLLEKYSMISESSLNLERGDFDDIINLAKYMVANKTFPSTLGKEKKAIKEQEQSNLCIIESTIIILNKLGALKKVPSFTYKE